MESKRQNETKKPEPTKWDKNQLIDTDNKLVEGGEDWAEKGKVTKKHKFPVVQWVIRMYGTA